MRHSVTVAGVVILVALLGTALWFFGPSRRPSAAVPTRMATSAAQAEQNAALHRCEREQRLVTKDGLRLSGTIDKEPVRAFLWLDVSTLRLVYYYPDTWSPFSDPQRSTAVAIEGAWTNDCTMTFHEAGDAAPSSYGSWMLRFESSQTLRGEWTTDANKPIRLGVAEAIACSGEGPWVNVAEPDWPVTFSRPANWLLFRDDDSITLVCPDPQTFVNQYPGIWLSHGRVEKPASNVEIAGFTKRRGQWFYASFGDCDDDSAGCSRACTASRDGMEILQGSGYYRAYAVGQGYVGASEQVTDLFLLGDRWVTLMEQNSLDGSAPGDAPCEVQDAGPGVQERIARSIGPPAGRPPR